MENDLLIPYTLVATRHDPGKPDTVHVYSFGASAERLGLTHGPDAGGANSDKCLDAAKRAIGAYLKSEKGRAYLLENMGYYTWGEALILTPAEFFRDVGLIPSSHIHIDGDVAYDENLAYLAEDDDN